MAKKAASSAKLGNKRLNKLGKQGKLKPKRKLTRQAAAAAAKRAAPVAGETDDADQWTDERAAPDEEDISFYTSSDAATGFGASFSKGTLGVKDRPTNTVEELYEQKLNKRPRLDTGTVKHLLPIKDKNRLIQRVVQEECEPGIACRLAEDDGIPPAGVAGEVGDSAALPEPLKQPVRRLTAVQLYAERQRKLRERKARIASLSCAVMESPELNIGKLRELRLLLDDNDPELYVTSRKLVMVSLLEIFKDILPGYRLRIATEKEKQQAAAKETRKLRLYEETLLSNYKHYLHFLEQVIKGDGNRAGSTAPATATLRPLAVDCLCQLMCERPEFNFFSNIVSVLVQQLACKSEEICEKVCAAAQTVFRRDKGDGTASLELVRAICRLIKARQFGVRSKVLDIFLSLRIVGFGIAEGSDKDKKQQMTHKEKMRSLSRRERKRLKQQKELDKELEEAEMQENQSKKSRSQTDITQAVFGLYFHVLKKATDSHLLSSVLSGLAEFAHCISIDFFGDLFVAFTELLEKDNLSLRDMLNLVHTAFTIISGQGSALNIDPSAFYTRLYSKLLLIPTDCGDEEMPLLLTCLDLMFAHRRKQVSIQRVLAFVKRICVVALQLSTAQSAAAALASVKTFMQTFPKVDTLYDPESVGSGAYLPELEEPEHCNAQCTRLYELHLMRHHYATVVADYAKHLCYGAPSQGRGQLAKEFLIQTPALLFQRLHETLEPVKLLDALPKRKTPQTSNKVNSTKILSLHHSFVQDEFKHLDELYKSETAAS